MAHLNKAAVYDIEDSNIALLGSDLEKRVRQESGDKESAWDNAGKAVGIQIWRIENFHVVQWPKERYGSFYDGDSYIILHTYLRSPDAESFSYDLHFWLGRNTAQDEAGTAAYKTVELDDHLHENAVQSREVEGYESHKFLSYFPRFISMRGGVATGFHHVSGGLAPNVRKLYRIALSRVGLGRQNLAVREILAVADSLVEGDVYVLDKGAEILQLNSKKSLGQERYKAAEFVQSLVNERKSQTQITVYDEGGSGAGRFFAEFGGGASLRRVEPTPIDIYEQQPVLYRISDATGVVIFETVNPISKESLSSEDPFLLDMASNTTHPTIFVWIGKRASLNEIRLSLQYAQRYLYDKKIMTNSTHVRVAIPIVRMHESKETPQFLEAI